MIKGETCMKEKCREVLRRYPWVVLFAVFIAVYTCWDMTQTNRAESELENRKLAQRPKLTWSSLMDGEYDERFDQYINDQFVGRDGWITLKSLCESALGKQENNGIVFGKDGYLFRKFESLDAEVPGRYEENIAYLREFCEMYPERSITMMLVPTASAVLKEKLPAGLELVDQKTEIEKIYARLPDSVDTLTLYETLDAHQDEMQLYYRTDHHWTTDAAYLAAQQYAEEKGMELPAPDTFVRREAEGFYGTNFSTSKKVGTSADTLVYYDIPVTGVTVAGEEKDGLYDPAPLEKRDKYASFLWGNNNHTVITSENAPADERQSRVLLIKDSYGNCFAPFLTCLYDVVEVVDVRFLNGMSSILEGQEYDDIIVLYNFETLAADPYLMRLRY